MLLVSFQYRACHVSDYVALHVMSEVRMCRASQVPHGPAPLSSPTATDAAHCKSGSVSANEWASLRALG